MLQDGLTIGVAHQNEEAEADPIAAFRPQEEAAFVPVQTLPDRDSKDREDETEGGLEKPPRPLKHNQEDASIQRFSCLPHRMRLS